MFKNHTMNVNELDCIEYTPEPYFSIEGGFKPKFKIEQEIDSRFNAIVDIPNIFDTQPYYYK